MPIFNYGSFTLNIQINFIKIFNIYRMSYINTRNINAPVWLLFPFYNKYLDTNELEKIIYKIYAWVINYYK